MKNLIETSITNEFKTEIWRKYIKAIEKYELFKPGDEIAVCIAPVKASMLLGKLIQMSAKYAIHEIKVKYLIIDNNLSEYDRNNVMENCRKIDIDPISVKNMLEEAKQHGCNKIAFADLYEDVNETILMNMLCNAKIETLLPKDKCINIEDMEVIRPLYLIRQDSVEGWAEHNGITFDEGELNGPTEDAIVSSTRAKMSEILSKLRKENALVDSNVFGSVESVYLEKVVGYVTDGEKHDFMENYL